MRVTVSKRLEWDAAHRVVRHESKCSTLHGHRYAAEVFCEADVLDSVGRVVDFGVIKERVGAWIDAAWDHTTIVNADDEGLLAFTLAEARAGKRQPYVIEGEPTAENIAIELLRVASRMLDEGGLRVVAVRIWETPSSYAEARA